MSFFGRKIAPTPPPAEMNFYPKIENAPPAQKEVEMSTAPVVPVVSTTPHPAWYARAGTWFLNIGRAIKAGILKVANEEPAIDAEIKKLAPTVEGISEIFLPGSAAFEAHILDVWGIVAAGVKDAGAATSANGLSLTLDQTIVDDIKGFLPAVEAYLHPAASPAPPPVATAAAKS